MNMGSGVMDWRMLVKLTRKQRFMLWATGLFGVKSGIVYEGENFIYIQRGKTRYRIDLRQAEKQEVS